MFPKIEVSTCLEKEKIAANIIHEDHIRGMLARTQNFDYKPWKSPYCPTNSHSPFGNFPKTHINPRKPIKRPRPVFEKAQASLPKDFSSLTLGGRACSMRKRRPKFKAPPPMSGARRRRRITPTHFRKLYDRGDIPIRIMHKGGYNQIEWKTNPVQLEYHHFLPVFVDGLREKMDPYRFLAILGTFNLIDLGNEDKIYNCILQLIIPLKKALNTRDIDIMAVTMKVIQKLALKHPKISENLVPYYRQLLPMFNLFKDSNKNIGDLIYYSQRKEINIGDLIDETLEILEKTGGDDAYINIRYMIPTYESCLQSIAFK